jgi:D-alanine-D-alanine ligase
MNKKKRVLILFGGNSGEHEVSLMSAYSVLQHIDSETYDIECAGITKQGKWLYYDKEIEKIPTGEWENDGVPMAFPPDPSYGGFILIDSPEKRVPIDVVFPVMHGPNCEDGTLQGVLEMAKIPYVGCGVMASAIAMDKAMTKTVIATTGIKQAGYYIVDYQEEVTQIDVDEIERRFEYPVFIKPANMGSSVGISKAHDQNELVEGLKNAAVHDKKIVVEEFIQGREIECAVLGNRDPKAAVLGEILPAKEFYDYQAKYDDKMESGLVIDPQDIPDTIKKDIQKYAIQAYQAIGCEGLARVDFFYNDKKSDVIFNEINTLPGFTKISMFPKLWQTSGKSYTQLINELIELALEK